MKLIRNDLSYFGSTKLTGTVRIHVNFLVKINILLFWMNTGTRKLHPFILFNIVEWA